jgi:hypothetical protein
MDRNFEQDRPKLKAVEKEQPLFDKVDKRFAECNETIFALANRLSRIADHLSGSQPETGESKAPVPPTDNVIAAFHDEANLKDLAYLVERLERL